MLGAAQSPLRSWGVDHAKGRQGKLKMGSKSTSSDQLKNVLRKQSFIVLIAEINPSTASVDHKRVPSSTKSSSQKRPLFAHNNSEIC